MLTEKQWDKLSQLMRSTGRVYNKFEHRMTFEGILYRMRTGCPWRDIPKELVTNSPTCDFTVADKGYDSEKFRGYLANMKGSTPMISRREVNLLNNEHMDWKLYKVRHFVENAFVRIKHFRAISVDMTN